MGDGLGIAVPTIPPQFVNLSGLTMPHSIETQKIQDSLDRELEAINRGYNFTNYLWSKVSLVITTENLIDLVIVFDPRIKAQDRIMPVGCILDSKIQYFLKRRDIAKLIHASHGLDCITAMDLSY